MQMARSGKTGRSRNVGYQLWNATCFRYVTCRSPTVAGTMWTITPPVGSVPVRRIRGGPTSVSVGGVSSARALLESIRADLAPAERDNRLVPFVEQGAAPPSVFGTIAAEELHIVRSDWRSLHLLASRAEGTAREFFAGLAGGEGMALARLPALAAAGGMDEQALAAYEPMAGCQAYPAYFTWLAVHAEPTDVIVAVVANFAAWGDYCGRITTAMRTRYGLDDEACAFFDLFATPAPEAVDHAVAAVQSGMDAGRSDERAARRYGRLFQSYELMFWNTIANQA
jgi:hypothetical protein